MDLGRAPSEVGDVDRAASFQLFSRSIDPEWIQEALEATGSATVRRRKLPAEYTLEREEVLRSREPERVLQEVWGLAVGYNLVRLQMERVGDEIGTSPLRLSYRHALMLIRNFWITAWLTSPGVLPRRLDGLQQEMALLILPARRPRAYPRAVKIKMSGYALKRPRRARRRLN